VRVRARRPRSVPPPPSTAFVPSGLKNRIGGSANNEESGREELTTKVTAEHQIEDKVAVLIVLEGIAKVDDEGVVDFLEKPTFLDNIVDGLLLYAGRLVDVLEGIQFFRLFV
jgi:hypothetical protein